MEVKKKFEKPQMEVVKLKPAGMVCSSSCPSYTCGCVSGFCAGDGLCPCVDE